ncbi:MAG: helix-turn-helix transcriptional regulator [Clostridia bacterium]
MNDRYMGEQICKRRRALGRTQEWLAERAEVSTSFVGHIERGSRKASLETLVKISLALQCTLDALAMPPHSDLLLDGYSRDELTRAQRLLEAALSMSKQ